MKRLYEKKDHLIRKNPNLTSEQKSEIIKLLGKHPSYENKIEWNKSNSLTYEDFLKVLRPLYINELDPRGLVEGQDYDILYESDDEVLYFVYSYEASKILASNNVEPKLWTNLPSWCGKKEFRDEAHAFGYFDSEHGDMKPGAKWCISMQTSNKYWNRYNPDFHFFFWFRDDDTLRNDRKIAIEVRKTTWQVAFLYNGADNEIEIELPSYIAEAINNEKVGYKEKEANRIKNRLSLNPQTNRYDYDGNLTKEILMNFFVSEDRNGFIVNFGKVTGNFICSDLGLKSLKGAPQTVGESFDCSINQLTSLEGAPQKVGKNFDCSINQLTSLEGAPQKVGKNFNCSYSQLTSLEGAPQKVGGDFYCQVNQLTSLEGATKELGKSFYCSNNKLTSLKGAPQKVGERFDCSNNKLISLKGAPQKIGGDFDCSYNRFPSLEGAPQEVGGIFYCSYNYLTSLKGAPQEVGGSFYCSTNQLISLEGAPQKVGGNFNCSYNKFTSLEGAPTEVGGNFICSDNHLTSLKGAPQKVGGKFDCRSNPNLHSLDGIGEVEEEIYKDF